MFTGFARQPEGATEVLGSIEDLAKAWAVTGTTVWVDFEAPTEDDLWALDRIIDVDDSSLEDCLTGEQRPRIDEFEDYLFMVFYGLLAADADEFSPRKLSVFLGPRFLITVHHEPLRTLADVRERCRKNPSQTLSRGVDFVLFNLIDGMVDRYVQVAEGYEERIDDLEEASIAPEVDESVLEDSAAMRHQLLDLRRLAMSQRDLLTPLAKGEYEYISESLEQRFRHVCDHLTTVIEQTDSLREHLANVRENYHTALTNRTNEIVKRLTLLATVMLPLTLIAGIFGMNVPLWPVPDHPASFWAILLAMGLFAGGLLRYFRRIRWM